MSGGPLSSQQVSANLQAIQARVAEAARRAGRSGSEITLVAVTKYVDEGVAGWLVDAGCHDLGESRPQELWRKAEAISKPAVRWHLVGHLQRNKVRRTLPLVSLIHSGDSVALLQDVNQHAQALGLTVPVLLEVNISGDTTKHGFAPVEMAGVLAAAIRLPNLRLRGLMSMAGRDGDLAAARRDFRNLRELRDVLRPSLPSSQSLDELSMGMSGDFEVAIEEGATIIRVGSALFDVSRS